MPIMQAPNYTPQTDFSDDESNNTGGRSTVRTDRLDAELDNVSESINAINDNLGLIQRDDGKLNDGLVEFYNLSSSCKAAVMATKWTSRGLWAPAQSYALNDMVDKDGASYICAAPHVSSDFATDYASGNWQIFVAASSAGASSFDPTDTISATNTQSAIEEVDAHARSASLPILASLYGGL